MTGTVAVGTAERTTFGSGPAADPSPPPPPGMAIDHPPTRAALGRHARRPFAFLAVGTVVALVGVGVLVLTRNGDLAARVIAVGAGLVLITTPWMALRWRWMRKVLRTSPWVGRHGHYEVTGAGRYAHAILLLEADEHGPEAVCTVPELRTRLSALAAPGSELDLWVAGDPTRRAVATIRGDDIVPIDQPRFGPWRRHLRRRMEIRGATRRS